MIRLSSAVSSKLCSNFFFFLKKEIIKHTKHKILNVDNMIKFCEKLLNIFSPFFCGVYIWLVQINFAEALPNEIFRWVVHFY